MRANLLLVLSTLFAFTGCATSFSPTASAPVTGAASLTGAVHGGQQPVVGAIVTLWAAGSSGYGAGATVIASATAPTDAGGNFSFATIPCPSANTPTYMTAQGGNSGYTTNAAIMLVTGLGPCSGLGSLNANINEVTTAATAYALSHFFTTALGVSSNDNFGGAATQAEGVNAGLALANTATIAALTSLSGVANPGSATMTTEAAKLNTIANILAACVNSAGPSGASDTTSPCGRLFAATTPPGATTAPSDTLQAAVQMALYPYQNVATLAALPPPASPFVGLATTPNDLTLAVSYTAPGLGLAINGTATSGTSSNLDIDAGGRVWFPTNTAAAHGLAVFDPASGSFAGPYVTALIHPQYLAIDTNGVVWGTDLAANHFIGALTTSPASVITFNTPNNTYTGPIGVTSNATVASDLMYSVTGLLGTTIYQENGGSQSKVNTVAYPATGLAPYALRSQTRYFEAEIADSGLASPCQLEAPYIDAGTPYNILVAITGAPCQTGGVAQLSQVSEESTMAASTLNELCSYLAHACFTPAVPLALPQGIAVDGDGSLWIANAGDGSVSTLSYARVTSTVQDYVTTSPIAYLHGAGQGATMSQPYGLAIDRSGNVWLSNAGCVSNDGTACTPGAFVLSELIGAAAPTLTPLGLQTTTIMNGSRPALTPAVPSHSVTSHAGARR